MLGRPNILGGRLAGVHVASGVGEPGVSIPVSTSGAVIGDILVIYSPYSPTPMTLGGTGWTTFSDVSDYSSSYVCQVSWKVIASTANVTIANEAFGHAWTIWRGPTSVGRAQFASTASTITVPSSPGNCMAQLIIASDQVGTHAPATPTGYTSLANGAPAGGAVFDISIFSIIDAFSGAATLTTAFWSGDKTVGIYALELRR